MTRAQANLVPFVVGAMWGMGFAFFDRAAVYREIRDSAIRRRIGHAE